jgi:uncharacterized protein (TIGR02001 family)
MKKILGTGVALALLTGAAFAADMPVKAPILKAAPSPLWDIAIGGSIASDYNFRGISQSDRGVSPAAYFELQYNWSVGQTYVGIGALGVDFASAFGFSDPSAEVDLYFGWRKTWGALSLDVGYIYYWYPKELFNTDWAEVYGKIAYAVTPNLTIGGAVFYTPDLLNFSLFTGGNDVSAVYYEVNAKWVTPWTYNGVGSFISGAIGLNDIEQVAAIHAVDPSYVYYNAGIAFTYKALTLDLRYHGTDMNSAECFAALGSPASGIGGRPAQKYCDDTFIAKLSFDTLLSNIK